ncbi:hypothetical protein OB955_22265 [Halobacteria archaeon AArc-m2/3/4]|uniref:Uncharacterized protein n=1 Tax=Natronoglomus mannanivorans TaxID=2979990 RepID=A0AAP2YYY4_9EURY|nr:hypothetical protein [Halobacteria archaeon AArc-xg1-1]MCU4975420.1 hypothetical protein [Halobacteria archaeon AArc-m2/3/4]
MTVRSQEEHAMSETNKLTAFLTDNPRLMGVLFTICLLLSQAGSAAAANGGTVA